MQATTTLELTPPWAGIRPIVTFVLVVGALVAGYRATLTPVTLAVDGAARQVYTHQDTVAALLLDLGLTLRAEDVLIPSPDTPIERGLRVEVRRARPVYIHADGHHLLLYTHAASVEEVLIEARLSLLPNDEMEVEGSLARAGFSTPQPVHITIRRAMPFTLHEDGRETTFSTTAPTVGEALRRLGVTLYIADGVQPALGERMRAGMDIYITRSIPVTVQADGRTLRARTHREVVGDVLADLGVVLTGQDYAVPPLDAPLVDDAVIRVVRVSERFVMEQEPIPYEITWQPDPNLEIDNERVMQDGAHGVLERRTRVRYEDGYEVERTPDGSYVAVPPTTKILGYGTMIVVRTLDTPSGPVEYWRKIRMLATSYSAGTSGTPRSSPYYGRTATGVPMRFGIVAVDPRIVSLGSRVYVPNYGVGLAADTGGAIRGNRIDLGYDDENLVLWYRWVDVYLLTPVPDRIDYVLD